VETLSIEENILHAFFKEDPSLNSNLSLQVNDIHISLFILSMIFDNILASLKFGMVS
ncbi:uncharacterized protein METZ01_LOCUS43717, partial [marine metagenome]